LTSPDGFTWWFVISTEAARDLHARVRMRVERGRSPLGAVAGLEITASRLDKLAVDDVYFGKSDNEGLLLARLRGPDDWEHIPARPGTAGAVASRLDDFEVMVAGGRYEFRLNGQVVARWTRPEPRAEWVRFVAGPGNRAEFRDWQVLRPQ
jgi:hypothetical protein